MHAYLQMGGGLLSVNMVNLVLKILMHDMTISEMVMVVVGKLVISGGARCKFKVGPILLYGDQFVHRC